MDNGVGEVITIWKPTLKGALCDGNWHTVRCQKAKNVITLEVDSVFSKPGVGESGVSKTDTNDPFYLGGVPARHRGIKTTSDYIGCIRNLELNNVMQSIGTGPATGDVIPSYCPTN